MRTATNSTYSPSSSYSSSATSNPNPSFPSPSSRPPPLPTIPAESSPPTPTSWESVSMERTRILALASLLPNSSDIAVLADTNRPARALLASANAYAAVSAALESPGSGSGDDPVCHWLYDTLLSGDADLRVAALAFLPLLSSLYLSRLLADSCRSLSGFEAVILAVYSSELKSRQGKPIFISVPDLSLPSLYHTPASPVPSVMKGGTALPSSASVGVLSPPLEPQVAMKSTKRAQIIGVAFDAYYGSIAMMPTKSKLDFCRVVARWAGQFCSCRFELDDTDGDGEVHVGSLSRSSSRVSAEAENLGDEIARLEIGDDDANGRHCNRSENVEDGKGRMKVGRRVPLPWELLQPLLRILGHCLFSPLITKDVKDAASVAVRCVYARASHEIIPQAILATRSLIQLDNSSKQSTALPNMVNGNGGSNVSTPSKQKKSDATPFPK